MTRRAALGRMLPLAVGRNRLIAALGSKGRFTSHGQDGKINLETEYGIILGMDDKKFPTGKKQAPEGSLLVAGTEALGSNSTHGLDESSHVSEDLDIDSQVLKIEETLSPEMQRVEAVQESPRSSSAQRAIALGKNFKSLDNLLRPSSNFTEQYAALTAKTRLTGLDALLGLSTKLPEQYAALTAKTRLTELDALLGPSRRLTEQYAVLTAKTRLTGLDALLGPSRKLTEQHAALTAKTRLDALLGSSKNLTEQYAALTVKTSLTGLNALLEPSRKLTEQYTALTAKTSLTGLGALFGPSTKLAEQYAAITAKSKLEGLKALVRPSKEMASLFASLKPLPSMRGVNALFTSGDSIAAGMVNGGSLAAAIIGSMTSLPSMVSLGASLASFGTTTATHQMNWDSIHPPSLLEAVGAAARLIEEDRHANSLLFDLIGQLSLAAHNRVTNEAAISKAAITRELSTAAQSGDVGHLSNAAKYYLSLLFLIISTLCAYLALQNGVREELCFLQPKIMPSMTSGQIGKSIRAAVCNVPLEMLADYRFVRGESVRLRTAPSAKANTIPISLKDGDLLEVLSAENRDWLHVRVVSEEGVEGWIYRRYAKQIIH
jgi:hypothetical protein